MKIQKGFTLIELLVVIAIIGILSSVVLASLNTARGKGADAAVKSTLANMRAEAAIWYDNNSQSYAAVCTDPVIVSALTAAAGATGATVAVANAVGTATTVTCDQAAGSFVFSSPLKTQNLVNGTSGVDYWCVDSGGKSTLEDTFAAANATGCI
jgi:type IV pilus assembly protein PilA